MDIETETEDDEQVTDFDTEYEEYEQLQAEYDAIDEQIRIKQIKGKGKKYDKAI